jgi:ribosome recycling factor
MVGTYMHKIIKDAEIRMRKCIDSFKHEITKMRTGRAHPSILDHVTVDYYGSQMPLNQVANINAADARTLVLTPYEKRMVPVIEKAILTSDLGLNPTTQGEVIRVPMPALNEERRRELIKVVRNEAEAARVSVRNVRRDGNNELKDLLKAKTMTEDEERRLVDAMQKLTDKYIVEIDQILSHKESELLAI